MTVPDTATVNTALFEKAADLEAVERAQRATAPAAADVEAIGAMDDDTRKALFALLSSLADNKYLLGRRYAEWCTGAPMLESAVAAAAMAQDELGHARSFYPLLRGFPELPAGTAMEGEGWQTRPTTGVRFLDQRFESWSGFVAANLLIDTAFTTLLEAATDSPYEPLRQRARKIIQEEDAHWVHAEGWALRLSKEPGLHDELLDNLGRAWDDAMTWFGLPDDEGMIQLKNASMLSQTPGDIRDRLRERVCKVLTPAGLAQELTNRPLPWDGWNPQTRRLA